MSIQIFVVFICHFELRILCSFEIINDGMGVLFMSAINKISEILKERGLTQKELALMAGIPPSTLSNYFLKRTVIPNNIIKNIAKALNISPLELLADEFDIDLNELKQPVLSQSDKETDTRSETRRMFDELMMKMAQQNPDIIVHFRDLQKNIDKLTPNDIQGLADAFAKLTGETNADIDRRLRKKSRHGDI